MAEGGYQGRNKLGRGVFFPRLGFRPYWEVCGGNPLDGGEVAALWCPASVGGDCHWPAENPPPGMPKKVTRKLTRRGEG